jgi:hypothetical protein
LGCRVFDCGDAGIVADDADYADTWDLGQGTGKSFVVGVCGILYSVYNDWCHRQSGIIKMVSRVGYTVTHIA